MSYTYDDLRRVERRIQELNDLCSQCVHLKNRLIGEINEPEDALMAAENLIAGRQYWSGPDADSCRQAANDIYLKVANARNSLNEMIAIHDALMDEVHRQQTIHNRIYRELSELEIIAGRIMD